MCDMLSARADRTQTELICEGIAVESVHSSSVLLKGATGCHSPCAQGTHLGTSHEEDDAECRMLLESLTVTCQTPTTTTTRDTGERDEQLLQAQQPRFSLTRRDTTRAVPRTSNASCKPLRLGCSLTSRSGVANNHSREEGGRRGRSRSSLAQRVLAHRYRPSETSLFSTSTASLTRRNDTPASSSRCTTAKGNQHEEEEEEDKGEGCSGLSSMTGPAIAVQRAVRPHKASMNHLRALSRSELRDWSLSRRSRSLTRARRNRRGASLRPALAALPATRTAPLTLPRSATSMDYASISCMEREEVARLHIRPLAARRPTLVSQPSSTATSRSPSHGITEDDERVLSQGERSVARPEGVLTWGDWHSETRAMPANTTTTTARTTSSMRFASALTPSHDAASANTSKARREMRQWSSEAPPVVTQTRGVRGAMTQSGDYEALPLVTMGEAESVRLTPRGAPASIMCRPSIVCHGNGAALMASELGRLGRAAGSPYTAPQEKGGPASRRGGPRRWKNALQHSSAISHEALGAGTAPFTKGGHGDEADMNGICLHPNPDEDEAERAHGSGSRKSRAMTVVVEGEVEGADHSHASHVTARMGDSASMESSCFNVFPRPFVPLHRRQWSVTSSFRNNMSCTRTRLLSDKFADNEFDQLTASEVLWTDM